VGTPIGNLDDMSFRAVQTLQQASAILAEDTRHTRKLLNHFQIATKSYSFHQHNEKAKEALVLDQLAAGRVIALVSDAGMPLISDPGSQLVAAARAAGHQVIPIPGPSAFLLALVASGLDTSCFTFCGFLPSNKKDRSKALEALAGLQHTLIFYCPPHDLAATLQAMVDNLGALRQCVVARELTKIHEEYLQDSLANMSLGSASNQ
jgi:16S rRNA (cytidine1402-2'-O)-methyltransferase